jgi:CDP-glucose 4,6-dehydratase
MNKKLFNFYKNKKILVTGATGFKGSWLCLWLTILGAQVYGIGNNPNKNKNLFYSLKLDKKISLKIFDIRNKKKLEKFIKYSQPEIVFHLAAQPLIYESYKNPHLTYDINCMGTLNILDIINNTKIVKSLVSITSDKCYENNEQLKSYKEDDKLGGYDPYSGSKACAEIASAVYRNSFLNGNIQRKFT